MPHTAQDVANWMFDQIQTRGELYQEDVVTEIQRRFGREFTYLNASGGTSIDKAVLTAFRQLTEKTVVYERGEKMWRKRAKYDGAGRQAQ